MVLLALGRVDTTGSSELPRSEAESRLADLIVEFGPASKTGRLQSAAYPFTRLRSDGVWQLDYDVPMDEVKPLSEHDVTGRFEPTLEASMRTDCSLIFAIARALVTSHFPETVASEVLTAVGLDPTLVLRAPDVLAEAVVLANDRRRNSGWRSAVLQAWDRQCAFCGYDGQLAGAPVGVEAAHVRWFAFEGPDTLVNGLALCVLHHKLFDLGALGLDAAMRVRVSTTFTTRTDAGRTVYDLHGRELRPRPGTTLPAGVHVAWHDREVFKGAPLAA